MEEEVAVPRHGPKGNPHKRRTRKKSKKVAKKRKKKRASPSFAQYGLTVAKKREQITTARGFTPS